MSRPKMRGDANEKERPSRAPTTTLALIHPRVLMECFAVTYIGCSRGSACHGRVWTYANTRPCDRAVRCFQCFPCEEGFQRLTFCRVGVERGNRGVTRTP